MKVGVIGAAGRMGRTLIEAVQAHDGLTLGAAPFAAAALVQALRGAS